MTKGYAMPQKSDILALDGDHRRWCIIVGDYDHD